MFVSVSCVRKLPYICYKKVKPPFYFRISKDYFISKYGYRLFLTKVSWEEARVTCEMLPEYKGRLVEIQEKLVTDHLLYIMSDNFTAIRHIWIGGQFDVAEDKWIWVNSGEEIDLSMLNWVKNKTYFREFNDINLCLNMDEENPYIAMHYGTACYARQNFICEFSK